MLLQKIKLKGFKSFADEVVIELSRGITAVVGPNGCGKSNIADSINWALGEQSPTSLRGKKMEQMIFNGSKTRQAMGMAEVTLSLSTNGQSLEALDIGDEDIDGLERDGTILTRLLKGAEGQISITRRMFRDSQSEYLLNGKHCRLKDVQDLLMALGIGTRVITIVEQDKISSVISAKPQDRRSVIEDAAGITKFKVNKHLTELKLDHARQNLERIDDLLGEQEIHVRSLRRQAAKANRFRKLQEEIRAIDTQILASRHIELSRQHRELEENLRELNQQFTAASTQLTQAESKQAELRQKIDELTAVKVETREKLYQHNLEIDRDTNRLKHLRDSIDELYKRSNQVTGRLEQSRDQLKLRDQRLTEAHELIEKLEKDIEEASRQLTLLKEQADTADTDLKSIQQKRETVLASLSTFREKRGAEKGSIEALTKEKERLAIARANAGAIIENTKAGISAIDDRLLLLERRKEDLVDREQQAVSAIGQINESLAACKSDIASLDRRIETLNQHRSNAEATVLALREMEERREGIEDAVKAVFDDAGISSQVKPIGIVTDYISVQPDYSAAVVAAYGDILESVLVENAGHAGSGIALLRKSGKGRSGFVALDHATVDREPAKADNDLRRYISSRGEYGDQLIACFPPAVVTPDLEEAMALAAVNPATRIATMDGTLVQDGAFIRGGSETLTQQIFTRRARIEKLSAEIVSYDEELTRHIGRKDDLVRRQEEFLAGLASKQKEIEQNKLQQVELSAQVRSTRDEKDRQVDIVNNTTNELTEFDNLLKSVSGRLESKVTAIENIETEITSLTDEAAMLEKQFIMQADIAGEAREKEGQLRAEFSTVEERLRGITEARKNLIHDRKELLSAIETAEKDLDGIEQNRVKYLREIEEIETGMKGKVEIGESLNHQVNELDQKLTDEMVKLKTFELDVKRIRKEKGDAQTRLEEGRLKTSEQILALQHLKERAAETLRIDPALIEQCEIDEEFDIDGARAQLEDLRQKVENMGPVNLLAEEEYNKHKERFETLLNQKDDVTQSIASLENVIRRIDQVSRARFKEAFEAINENFHRIFRIIFQGGKAELVLSEDDVLTSGIEIVVQPPGKRPQGASLLSGGEKSLAAFSLFLAVMEFRPTPFCVLDESDAALDESNIRRVASIIKDRADHTQFIVITHNKTTMEVADQLYGVTMTEPGVSNVVSVKFN